MKARPALQCPAAPQWWPDAVVWGVAAGTAEAPRVVPIAPQPVTEELLALAFPATPREVFRFAATCVKGECRHWRSGTDGAEGRCSLVERVVAQYPEVGLQPCGIRSACRWFAQEGPAACRVCPGVVTDYGELPQDADSEGLVKFF